MKRGEGGSDGVTGRDSELCWARVGGDGREGKEDGMEGEGRDAVARERSEVNGVCWR